MLPEGSSTNPTAFLPHGVARTLFMCNQDLIQNLYLYAAAGETTNVSERRDFWRRVTAQQANNANGDDPDHFALANVLALLICCGVDSKSEEWMSFVTHCMAPSTFEFVLRDDKLPLSVADVILIFGRGRATVLHTWQFQFCPAILKQNQLLTLPAEIRLPYMDDPTELGQGAYGVVHMVRIAPQHWRGEELNPNRQPKYLARKDLKIDEKERYRKDWTNVQWLVKNHTETKDVMIALASFEQGSIFSVFFEYAPLGDLWNYFQNEQRRSDDWDWKQNIVQATFAVARGLNHLHNELRDKMDHISCFHTDLKPSNILVVHRDHRNLTDEGKVVGDEGGPQSDITFKITDFGLSGITRARVDADASNPFKRLIRHPREILSARDQSVSNNVGHGSHCLAPEALPRDTWLHDGWDGDKGVDKFSSERQDASNFRADYFFALADPRASKRPRPTDLEDTVEMGSRGRIAQVMSINPAVPRWFKHVITVIEGRPEEAMYRRIWELLERSVLVANPQHRVSIKDVEKALEKVLYDIRVVSPSHQSVGNVRSGPYPSSSHTPSSRVGTISPDREILLTTLRPMRSKTPASTTPTLGLHGTTKCLASPNGAYVAFAGHNIVYVYALSSVLMRSGIRPKVVRKTDDHDPQWTKFCLSNKHLCVMSTDDTRTVFDHYNLTSETGPSKHRSEYGKCRDFVVSPDGSIIVFGVVHEVGIMIHLIGRGDRPDGQTSGQLRFRAGALTEIEELRFSAQGRYLSVVERTESPRLSVRVHTWDFDEGEEREMYQFYPDNTSFRGGSRTIFTSIVHLPKEEPGFVLALQGSGLMMFDFRTNILKQIVAPEEKSNRRLFLWSLDEHESIIVVGKSQGGRRVGIFETLGYQDASSCRKPSAITVAEASDTNCASVYTAENGALFLVLCRCKGKLEILSLT
ncbi:hypothetical protein LTR22_018616 [Elasticomyces elasticus]|nr:hypothetical protein LTR22_018616 [Elasticomyces elasticus]KAK4912283.1 hypothetical protein LTR49_019284 [Elasticomyces elasticus]KAK5751783.1 hypothetical protein LTS12_018111 [Elasticomyces elasticus]